MYSFFFHLRSILKISIFKFILLNVYSFFINVQLYSAANSFLLADLFSPIPEVSTVTAEGQKLDPLEFSSDRIVTYRHDGVGSGEGRIIYDYFVYLIWDLQREFHTGCGKNICLSSICDPTHAGNLTWARSRDTWQEQI